MSTVDSNTIHAENGLPLWRCSNEQYLRMIETGVLGPDDHVELIDGIIVAMSPSGSQHNQIVMRLTRLLAPLLDQSFELLIQGTVCLGQGQILDPDIAVIRQKPEGYGDALPTAEDIALIIEVADTSIRKDQGDKLKAYARHGVEDYWIIDVNQQSLIIHRQPADDRFEEISTAAGGDSVQPLNPPDFSVTVNDILR